MKEIRTRTVVIGSGCAGLNAADLLAMHGESDFVLVTENMQSGTSRNTGSDKQTYYKLSLAGDDGDSVGAMADTLKHDDVNGDTALCEAASSAACFLRLASLGVPFPMNEFGEYVGYQTDHDTRKRASSAGPLTSKLMTEVLERSVRSRNVRILDHTLACRILRDEHGVCGLLCLDTEAHDWLLIHCAHIILCTGGPAHIYQNRVYPASQFGSSGLAFEAGAEGANLDCWQYGLASVKFRWNVSGSYQQAIPRYVSVDEEGNEHEFLAETLGCAKAMALVFLKGYQWPYDERKKEGSSLVDILVKAEEDKGRRVYMDYRRDPSGWELDALSDEARSYLTNCGAAMNKPIERLRAINAPAIELYHSHGIDIENEMLEIRVCAQHHNGGIAVDQNWQTCIPGLYACGEVAGTFGKVRPGGTALNSTQVGSMRAVDHITHHPRPIPDTAQFTALLLPGGDIKGMTASFQREMTRCAAFQRDTAGMRALLQRVNEALDARVPLNAIVSTTEARIRLNDLLLTQKEVLSAMIFACENTEPGVLLTKNAVSRRVAARPIPERDLWFERVWKEFRERGAGQ